MIFSLDHVINSLAGLLKSGFPDYPVYASPNQQGTAIPCFFVFFMPSTAKDQAGGRILRDLGVDIIFVQERNKANGNAKIMEIADFLDEKLPMFLYSDGGENGVWFHTFDRQWKSEDEELHYQFHIRERVYVPRNRVVMQEMEGDYAYIKKDKE